MQDDGRRVNLPRGNKGGRASIGCEASLPYFDAVAGAYSRGYQENSPGGYALRIRKQRVVELLDKRGGRVLDVGCGPGMMVQELLDLGCEFWGVDASPNMIVQCRAEFGNAHRAHFAVSDATSLPFPDGFFDTVICTGVIGHVRAAESAIKEMARVVKRNGTLLVSFPNLLSPYAAWKLFVFYPAVALLRPVYYRLAGRPQPPSLYRFGSRDQFRSLRSAFAELHTARAARELIAVHGAEAAEIVYFYFNVFLSPVDELFPRWTLAVVRRLEGLRRGRLKWLGAGFIVKAQKRR